MSSIPPIQGTQHIYQSESQGVESKTAQKVTAFMTGHPLQPDRTSPEFLKRIAPGQLPRGSIIKGVETEDVIGSIRKAQDTIS